MPFLRKPIDMWMAKLGHHWFRLWLVTETIGSDFFKKMFESTTAILYHLTWFYDANMHPHYLMTVIIELPIGLSYIDFHLRKIVMISIQLGR